MEGINLERPITYKYASLRYFLEGEHHVSRLCRDDVLLLVFDGVLRFTEDGKPYEIHKGEYHIQRHGSLQEGAIQSDAPKYLYVHFLADWESQGAILEKSGNFDYAALKSLMEEMDKLAHIDSPYILQAGKFYAIIAELQKSKALSPLANEMASFIEENLGGTITLDLLSTKFHFSKNHIINIFKKNFSLSPIEYTNSLRLKRAEHLMEATSDSLEKISLSCGFSNYSHFYKLFIKKNSCSPERWREQRRIG